MSEEETFAKHVIIPEKSRLKLLEMAMRDIFGITAEIEWKKIEPEVDHITIKNIEWSDSLIEVLSRLTDDFYVEVDTEIEWIKINEKEKEPYSYLVVNLYPREWEE